jgi:hypothetical protein
MAMKMLIPVTVLATPTTAVIPSKGIRTILIFYLEERKEIRPSKSKITKLTTTG